jgi:hypothetical protein
MARVKMLKIALTLGAFRALGSGINNEVLMNDLFIVKGKGASWLEGPGFIFPTRFIMSSSEGTKGRQSS